MIEKLSEYKITSRDGSFINVDCNAKIINTLVQKINELVDAVNGILAAQEQYATIYKEDIVPMLTPKNEEPTDPYAEQRKWIGKVCVFWDNDDTQEFSYGVLTKIDTESGFGVQYCCNDEYDYDNCEPVKPDDDIIYKGDNNE